MWPFTKKKVTKEDNLEKLEEFKRAGYFFVFGYVPDYIRTKAGDNILKLTENGILEKVKTLSDNNFGENLLLMIVEGKQDFSDASVNSYRQQYGEFRDNFEKITGSLGYISLVNWKPYSSKAAELALEKVLWYSSNSNLNFDAVALVMAGMWPLPYEIMTKIQYFYLVDQNTCHLDSNVFADTIKGLITKSTKPVWDGDNLLMPVKDKKAWKNNMQVFHVYLNESIHYMKLS